MHRATAKKHGTGASLFLISGLVVVMTAGAAQAVPINTTPGAITCTIGEPGSVGDASEGFLDPTTNSPEIELEGFDGVDCGPSDPGTEPPPPQPPVGGHDGVFVNDRLYLIPNGNDLDLHGLYQLHGMYGFVNNGVYGVYNLHGKYNVQGILEDGSIYNFDRYGDAAAPVAVPEPTTVLLFGAGLVGLLGVARRKR